MNRRELLKLCAASVAGAIPAMALHADATPDARHADIEQWGTFEASANGPSSGNPFVDVTFGARFTKIA